MPELRAITLPNNVTYNFVDGEARAHLVSQYTISCAWQGDDAQGAIEGSADYGEIVNCLYNGGLPILYIESPTGEFIPGYPCMSDSAGIYQFVAFAAEGYILYTDFLGGQQDTQCYVYRSWISIPGSGTVGHVLTKTASGYAWQPPVKYLDVTVDADDWDDAGTTAHLPGQEDYSSIKQYMANGQLVIIRMLFAYEEGGPTTTNTYWLFPQQDDVYDNTWLVFATVDFYSGGRYQLEIYDGDQGEVTVRFIAGNGVPTNGAAGQVLTKTANGYAWQSLPVYDGSVS